MRKASVVLFLMLLFAFGFPAPSEKVEASNSSYQLCKVYLENKEQYRQVATMSIDIVDYKSDYLEVFASQEQISMLNGMGLKIEKVPLSEVVDESVTAKTDSGLYHTYTEVESELRQIELTHGNIAKVFVIGKSIEGRNISAIKISDNPTVEEPKEPEVLYMGCHHAREWISVEIPMHLANYLTTNYGIDPNITRLVNERETWIVPITNPDGLVYSQTVYTMWRKNKRDNNNDGVFEQWYDGVDINRNYGYKWGYDDVGSSPYPSDEDYRGKSAFSEPETQAIRDLALQHHFVFSISYHSYGELIVYPWGYANADTADDKLFTDVASRMARFNSYTYGNPKDGVIYNTNGDSDDWLYGNGSTLAYTFELGTMFIPPESQIEQVWLRNKYASLYLLQIANDPHQIYPSIRVYTDKMNYSKNDTIKVGLNLTNPQDAINVGVGVWADLPSGGKYWVVQEPWVTLPRGFSYSNPTWKSYALPSLQPGKYSWHAVVVDPFTYYVLSESISQWTFSGP